MPKILPFAPMPLPMLKSISKPFMRFSANTKKMFPKLEYTLKQAEINLTIREYGAIMIFLVLFYMIFFGGMITLLLSKVTEHFLWLGLGIGLLMGLLIFVQIIMYPTMLVRKKTRAVEKNMVFALRAILVQLKSGVSLFDSMSMVAKGDYGILSEEFQKAVDAINTGTPEQYALEEMGERNPSPYLRKSLWQIVNGMSAGADISAVLGETVSSMIREQKLAISKYGSQLRVLSLMYMMIGVIMPALGVTLLIILFTFPMVGDAIDQMPILVDSAKILQDTLPGEVYKEGEYIEGLSGKQNYSGSFIRLKVSQIEGKRIYLTAEDEAGKTIQSESIYGVGSNIAEVFTRDQDRRLFAENVQIKSVGKDFFGQDQIEVTRLERVHLVFWVMLAAVALLQFMYIGIIKSRRPSIIG
jgi:pilus assembly protein TadC